MIGKATQKNSAEALLYWYARHFPIVNGKMRIVDRMWKWCCGDDLSREAVLKYGSFKMQCDISFLMQRQFYFFGTYFQEEQNIVDWMECAKDSEVILDVGANLGIYSLAALAANPRARVHAFEPTPEIAGRLAETMEKNGLQDLVRVNEMMVGENSDSAYLNFCTSENGKNEGMNYITQNPVSDGALEVVGTTLDDYCKKNELAQLDLVKIDVQGNEPSVLRGAEELLRSRAIKTIFMELNWSDDIGKCPATETVKLLEANGFRFRAIRDTVLRGGGDWMRDTSDVVAVCQAG
jgi:FkbM family methyltransferase